MISYKLKNGRDYIVRRANENDIEQLLYVLLKVAKEDEIAPLSFEEAEQQILSSKERLYDLLKKEDHHFLYLVGIVDERIISFCDIHIGRNKRDSHIAEFGRSVLKDFRRTGAGKFLQQEAIRFVRELGTIEKIELNISSNNKNSIESCKHNGFTLEAIRKNKLKLGAGIYVDLHTYVMDI